MIGVALSCLAYWIADRADERRVHNVLAFRAEWRARDIEAKVRLSGNAVESIAIGMTANPALDASQFGHVAARAASGLVHVNALEWAPRVGREGIPAFEAAARARGLKDYRVFDVTPDFHWTELAERPEYFPVLYEERFHGTRRALGLARGRYDGRRIPMEKAAAEGPAAALARLRNPETKVDLLFTDIVIPGGMNGHQLADAARSLRPGLQVLFTSGYSGSALRSGDRLVDRAHFLSKPYRRDDLARMLDAVFGRADAD